MLKKLSLAALIAMGSMSVASATPLTEAIKGVDLSGMIRVRFYNEDPENGNKFNRWRTSSDFKFTIPVSEELKVVYKLGVEGNAYTDDDQFTNVAKTKFDPSPAENLVFLKYANNGLGVILGKIPVATSITGKGHGEAHGAGAIATFKASDNLTVAGAWVNAIEMVDAVPGSTTVAGVVKNGVPNDIYVLAAIFNVDMVSGNVWYYKATDAVDYIWTVSADVKPINGVKLHADYAKGELEADNDAHTYYNVSASYAANGLSALVGYADSNDKGTLVVLDNDSPVAYVIPTANHYSIANKLDTTALYAKVGYNIDNKTNVYVAYQTQNDKTAADNDLKEYTVGAKYKYNKKLGFHVYYDVADFDAANADNNEFRFEAKYTF